MKASLAPALFAGHGSPLNAIQDNGFTRSLKLLGEKLPALEAILVLSAHWETDRTQVLGQEWPETIHDFYGFSKELYEISYPAPGAPAAARLAVDALADIKAEVTQKWGFDHGTWSVLRHLKPLAEVPVFQVSLNRQFTFREHFEAGKLLAPLRSRGIMILGSGNIVHNLSLYDPDDNAAPFGWAAAFDMRIKEMLFERHFGSIIDLENAGDRQTRLSIPTFEHFVPLLYVLGASHEKDNLSFPFEGIQNASMSMRTVLFADR